MIQLPSSRTPRLRAKLVLCVAFFLLVSCSTAPGSHSSNEEATSKGSVIVRAGSIVFTDEELLHRLPEPVPFVDFGMRTLKNKKAFVENLVEKELLLQDAIEHGVDKSPEVQAAIKAAILESYSKQIHAQKYEPTEEELRTFFDEHQKEFVRPERRRVQQIFLAAPEMSRSDDVEIRSKIRAKAEALLATIRKAEPRGATVEVEAGPQKVMAELARYHSDHATSAWVSDGDLRFQSQSDLVRTYSLPFAAAVFQLTPQRRLSNVIETPQGFHIARLLGIQPEKTPALSDPLVRHTVRDRCIDERGKQRVNERVVELKSQVRIEIDEEALNGLELRSPRSEAATGPF
jgi:hypothetical protein